MISCRQFCVGLSALLGATLFGCSPNALSEGCGKFFGFLPSADANSTGQAALFELSFTHTPNSCPVTCNRYWFVQAIRPLDLDSGKFIQPLSEQQDRIVTSQADEYLNGWALDRKSDRQLGWYGVYDDFTLESDVYRMGVGSTPAKMHDTLSRGPLWAGKRMQVVGITVAVGLDQGTPCAGKMLGVQKWMVVFGHDDATNTDTVTAPVLLPNSTADAQAFWVSVDRWNKHLDDGRVRLPWADPSSGFSLP